jgi:acyl-CoA thioester hydrolase
MARIKLAMPDVYSFSTRIPIRITDLNYGGHVGNDIILSIIHESRVQFLQHYGYKEFDLQGAGLIMSDVVIEFKNEIFYGDTIKASIVTGEFSQVRFEVFYKLEKESGEKNILVANAKTGMVCYDYALKKVVSIPVRATELLNLAKPFPG